jgi:tRNA pseudouridine38-40 synthase
MRNLKLTVAYEGTPYHGWQTQAGVPTVQGELETALGSVLDQPVTTHGSGRTDAGVHALGQVANFRTDHSIDATTLERALNALLPPEIRVTGAEEVSLEFHARKSARSKTYEYRLWRSPVVPPFRARYVHALGCPMDVALMRRAASEFVGVHDFTSFSAAASTVRSRVREVYESVLLEESAGDEWVYRIRANGFLQHMVRTIMGTLIEVGRGRLEWQDVRQVLAARDRRKAGPSAPAGGLHLVSVDY